MVGWGQRNFLVKISPCCRKIKKFQDVVGETAHREGVYGLTFFFVENFETDFKNHEVPAHGGVLRALGHYFFFFKPNCLLVEQFEHFNMFLEKLPMGFPNRIT